MPLRGGKPVVRRSDGTTGNGEFDVGEVITDAGEHCSAVEGRGRIVRVHHVGEGVCIHRQPGAGSFELGSGGHGSQGLRDLVL